MTLQTSGAISLANIQTEFGGSNPISLSEYYAGGTYVPSGTSGTYGPVPSSGAIEIKDFYGTSASLDTQTVTVGTYTIKTLTYYGYASASPSAFGSISDGTFNVKSGAAITSFYHQTSGNTITFGISGAHTNAGWTTLNIAGTNLTRASATFSNSTNTSWTWSNQGNLFGTTLSATKICTFT